MIVLIYFSVVILIWVPGSAEVYLVVDTKEWLRKLYNYNNYLIRKSFNWSYYYYQSG